MPEKPIIENVLASRYASPELTEIWSAVGKIRLEREFWIAVMRGQQELGLAIPQAAIDAYQQVKDQVDLASILARERQLRHDVKARIEEFCALAGYEYIHQGLTSRDLTDNIEQLQIHRSLQVIQIKYAAALYRLAERVAQFEGYFLTARTHNVPAQLTTFGKRLAMFGQEMLLAFRGLEELLAHYPLRGLKGAVGTQLDQLTLFAGNQEKVQQLENKIAEFLGFNQTLFAVGQVYPRSLDFEVVSTAFQLAAGINNFARSLRLMTGHELVSEGFQKGQVGSSVMPHKMNSRSSERINGLYHVLNGFLNMTMGIAGDQWHEGDVSCSVVRRVALPNAMFALDAILETFLTILKEMVIFAEMLEAEVLRHLPFLVTTTILMEAIKQGVGRETAHAVIKEHAIAVVQALRRKEISQNDLIQRLAQDPRLGLNLEQLTGLLNQRDIFCGNAPAQTAEFIARVEEIVQKFPAARTLAPSPLL
ncbi:adenylosuccinate lyase [candidate division KSB1 bacterium]|nr:adenylosuccinate lyase [candidate division KSB1 bacterium]